MKKRMACACKGVGQCDTLVSDKKWTFGILLLHNQARPIRGGILMLPSSTIRGWHIDQLRKDLQILDSILKTISPQDATTYRDGGTGWTVLEVLCHLRDYETVFLERAAVTVEQEFPTLPNPNPDEWAAERRYNEQDLSTAYNEWVNRRQTFLSYLEGLDEPSWQRTANHPRRGSMSLQDQLTLTAWHDVNHIEQITRILAERKTG
jgi:uncharacterized damage-inducible protein DinB